MDARGEWLLVADRHHQFFAKSLVGFHQVMGSLNSIYTEIAYHLYFGGADHFLLDLAEKFAQRMTIIIQCARTVF